MKIFAITALATAMLLSGAAQAAEVRIAPADFIVLNPTNANAGYADLVVHAAGVRAGTGEHLQVQALRIEVLAHGQVVLTETVPAARLVADTGRLAQAPVREFMTGQLLDPAGADGVFGAPTTFAPSADLAPGQALFTVRQHFSVGFQPDQVRVIALGGADAHVIAQATVPVRPYRSLIAYRSPLQGAWLMRAVPSIGSHHRLNPSTEFAEDFFKIDAEGRTYVGDRLDPKTFFGWGQPVNAAADGEVVMVVADQTQDRAAFLPKAGETPPQAGVRIEAMMLKRARRNFAAAEAGNIVTLRHNQGGVTEYSSYGHLRAGSVRVKVGDHVTQGQQIGEVGDTGDSPAVHLHFQINAGPDPFTSKSLPFAFTDVRNTLGDDELGRMVTTAPRS